MKNGRKKSLCNVSLLFYQLVTKLQSFSTEVGPEDPTLPIMEGLTCWPPRQVEKINDTLSSIIRCPVVILRQLLIVLVASVFHYFFPAL